MRPDWYTSADCSCPSAKDSRILTSACRLPGPAIWAPLSVIVCLHLVHFKSRSCLSYEFLFGGFLHRLVARETWVCVGQRWLGVKNYCDFFRDTNQNDIKQERKMLIEMWTVELFSFHRMAERETQKLDKRVICYLCLVCQDCRVRKSRLLWPLRETSLTKWLNILGSLAPCGEQRTRRTVHPASGFPDDCGTSASLQGAPGSDRWTSAWVV